MDRLKFKTPYYLPDPDGKDQFIGFEYWNAVDGRPQMMVSWGKDEQCTGLKDKNGNLIYEGDIVKDDSLLGRKYTVNWDCDNVQFEATANFYDTELSEIYSLYVDSAKELEIVGNIHEQKDNK